MLDILSKFLVACSNCLSETCKRCFGNQIGVFFITLLIGALFSFGLDYLWDKVFGIDTWWVMALGTSIPAVAATAVINYYLTKHVLENCSSGENAQPELLDMDKKQLRIIEGASAVVGIGAGIAAEWFTHNMTEGHHYKDGEILTPLTATAIRTSVRYAPKILCGLARCGCVTYKKASNFFSQKREPEHDYSGVHMDEITTDENSMNPI